MSELPKGWVETTIDRITSDVSYGVTAKSDPHQGDLRMLRITDIQNNKVDWETVPFCLYDSRFEKAFLANEDIVVARTGATVGKSFLIENAIENSVYASYLIRLRVAEHVLPKYVAWFLHSPKYWQQIIEKQEGIGQPNVNGTKLKTLQLSLAPLAEQKRIVEKLDQVLAQVDTIKARLDGIPAILKRFRQSVLAAAVSGKLTEEWRKTVSLKVPNIDEIKKYWKDQYDLSGKKFKSADLSEKKNFINLPKSWLTTQIGDVCDVFVGATPSRKKLEYWNGGIPWVSSSEVAFCRISSTKELITVEGLSNTSTQVHPVGTVMLAMIGQGKTRGQVAILNIEACHNQNTAALRVPNGYVLSEFLYFFLTKQYEETRRIGAGNNQKALNKSFVQSLSFPLPSFEEQTEIVRLVDQYFAFADTIEKQVQKAQQRVDKLTQSILAKAFRGELVPQDPTDEPAEELLKRIAAARAESEALACSAKKTAKKVGKKTTGGAVKTLQ